MKHHTLDLLHQMIGPDKNFRPGQWEAIEAVAVKKQRALVVQRTGWGKSLVYFQKGTIGFPHSFQEDRRKLQDWLKLQAAQIKPEPFQPGLF